MSAYVRSVGSFNPIALPVPAIFFPAIFPKLDSYRKPS
jgi:hypothetical protein